MRVRGWQSLTLALLWLGCGQETELPEARPANPLRVIVRPDPIAFLPQDAFPVALDRQIADGLAAHLGRELVLIPLDNYPEMQEYLLAGKADLIASSLTATEERQEEVAFSLPYLHVDELLVVPRDHADQFQVIADLDSTEVCARPSSSYYSTLVGLRASLPGLVIRHAPENMDSESIVAAIAEGGLPATILDSNYWTAVSRFYDNLAAPLIVAEDRPIALAFHPDSTELRTRANEFLIFNALTGEREDRYVDDLPGMEKRKRLRVLTRNNITTYFLHRGTQLGYEYELIRKFAEEKDLLLEIVIPPTHADLIPWLLEGRGDVICAAMTVTPERSERVRFTRPYLQVDQMLVCAADDTTVREIADLGGRRIAIRKSSAFYETLLGMTADLPPDLEIELVPEFLETERILASVESREYDLTICDSHLLDIEITYGRRLLPAFSLGTTELGWAFRPGNLVLGKELDDYLRREHRGLFANMMFRRYFEAKKHVGLARDEFRSDISGVISPFDDLARRHALAQNLDWRLLVALMYQESRFDPKKTSWAGARGVMQIMPATARELGVDDTSSPEQSIEAGARYLRSLMNRFESELPLETRIRFGLAAYNAGFGHVTDARRLAKKQGWDPDVWPDNVERAMLLLQRPQYYVKARYGYCRGSETVKYVSAIERRYERFVEHVPERASTRI